MILVMCKMFEVLWFPVASRCSEVEGGSAGFTYKLNSL